MFMAGLIHGLTWGAVTILVGTLSVISLLPPTQLFLQTTDRGKTITPDPFLGLESPLELLLFNTGESALAELPLLRESFLLKESSEPSGFFRAAGETLLELQAQKEIRRRGGKAT